MPHGVLYEPHLVSDETSLKTHRKQTKEVEYIRGNNTGRKDSGLWSSAGQCYALSTKINAITVSLLTPFPIRTVRLLSETCYVSLKRYEFDHKINVNIKISHWEFSTASCKLNTAWRNKFHNSAPVQFTRTPIDSRVYVWKSLKQNDASAKAWFSRDFTMSSGEAKGAYLSA